MYSSGCGRRGPSVPRRYYALLLTTADKPIVRSTVRKNINYKDYPNNWARKYCEQKDYTNKREYTCWLMQWEIYQVYLQETRAFSSKVDHVILCSCNLNCMYKKLLWFIFYSDRNFTMCIIASFISSLLLNSEVWLYLTVCTSGGLTCR